LDRKPGVEEPGAKKVFRGVRVLFFRETVEPPRGEKKGAIKMRKKVGGSNSGTREKAGSRGQILKK